MGSLIATQPKHIRVLDPGAGLGHLAVAVCEQLLKSRYSGQITLYLFENDAEILPILRQNMKMCHRRLMMGGLKVSIKIDHEDFLHLDTAKAEFVPVDVVVMNPPYFKIRKDSEYARVMSHVVHGQPNIYALFMAKAVEMLRPGGEIVAITPRSFCNGPYFRAFRQWFFSRMSLKYVHLFESRTDPFRDSQVLQENVITISKKHPRPQKTIEVSASFGRDFLQQPITKQIPNNIVFDNSLGELIIRIPQGPKDQQIIRLVDSWPKRFGDLGLRVSTGPVVSFRATEFLLESLNGSNSTPLLSLHNVRPFKTGWPLQKNGKPLAFKVSKESERLLLPRNNYVLLRRFSSKEERRRLTASCFLSHLWESPYVALENHLNYIYHATRNLTENEVYGLAALFNSMLLDQYFRTVSGNTQVNAAEIRSMRFPSLSSIANMGSRLIKAKDFSPSFVENVVLDELGIRGTLKKYLTEPAT